MTVLLVALGAAVGAPLRYLTDRAVQARHDSVFPWGTFTVNIVGCALLGFLIELSPGNPVTAFAGTGLCGTLTTFSTLQLELYGLVDDGEEGLAVAYLAATLAAGYLLLRVGIALETRWTRARRPLEEAA